MAIFCLRAEFEEGRSVKVNPDYVQPLAVSDIRTLENDHTSALEMHLEADDAIIDGGQQVGRAKVKTKIVFHESTTIYALVRGGWLPLPFAIPARFLVDRNVIISLRKIREGKVAANAESLQWWIQFFARGNGVFNPLPFAFESKYRRKPTFSEFALAYDEGVFELREALPGCQIVNFQENHYQAAYAQLEAFDSRNEREVRFLQATCPLVFQRVPRKTDAGLAEKIMRAADSYHLNRASFAVLAVLSCVYEDIHGTPPAIGREILKPKQAYSESDAFNALSDLRHLEMAAAGQAYFKNDAFTLCTCDRPLALLWSALSVRGESPTGGAVDFTFDLSADLFSRLGKEELYNLSERLRA